MESLFDYVNLISIAWNGDMSGTHAGNMSNGAAGINPNHAIQ